MINIRIDIKSDFIEQIELKGHSGSALKGNDLICCSISTLTISLINSLTDIVKADIETELSEGYSLIKIKENNNDELHLWWSIQNPNKIIANENQ